MLILISLENDMGLDNIPKKYPCESVASKTDGRIDCDKTKACGNCTWENEYKSNPLVKDIAPSYGLFGTSCWYRGKYGNALLSMIDGNDDPYADNTLGINFYGDGFANGDEGIDADDCISMSELMADNTEKFAFQIKSRKEYAEREKDLIQDWIYASWWLKFAGEKCNGSSIWY
jgi:hypothetical protein